MIQEKLIIPEGIYDAFTGKLPVLNIVLEKDHFKKVIKGQLADFPEKLKTLEDRMNTILENLGKKNAFGVAQLKYDPLADNKLSVNYKVLFKQPDEMIPAAGIINSLIDMAQAYKEKMAYYLVSYRGVAKVGNPIVSPQFDKSHENILRQNIEEHIKYFRGAETFVNELEIKKPQ